MNEEKVWADMRERLMALTLKELKATAKAEGIALGYDGSRKDTTVARIVSERKARVEGRDRKKGTPWRSWKIKTEPVRMVTL